MLHCFEPCNKIKDLLTSRYRFLFYDYDFRLVNLSYCLFVFPIASDAIHVKTPQGNSRQKIPKSGNERGVFSHA